MSDPERKTSNTPPTGYFLFIFIFFGEAGGTAASTTHTLPRLCIGHDTNQMQATATDVLVHHHPTASA